MAFMRASADAALAESAFSSESRSVAFWIELAISPIETCQACRAHLRHAKICCSNYLRAAFFCKFYSKEYSPEHVATASCPAMERILREFFPSVFDNLGERP